MRLATDETTDTTMEGASAADQLREDILRHIRVTLGNDAQSQDRYSCYLGLAQCVRERLLARWTESQRTLSDNSAKRVYYLSMEFLIGRSLGNAMLALELAGPVREALRLLDIDPDSLPELEPDAALGNGGLGRLAACFLDSMATLGVPGFGYGIRYDYGMFRQQIVDGQQVEVPDYWLTHGNPWEFPRPEIRMRIRFGGHLQEDGGRVHWVGTDDVLAMAYDSIIPGYGTEVTNTLRLWSARHRGDRPVGLQPRQLFRRGGEQEPLRERLTRALPGRLHPRGPRAAPAPGVLLRLRHLQDIMRRYKRHGHTASTPCRQGQRSSSTTPTRARGARADAPAGRRSQGLPWDAAWALCTAGVLLHQPHPAARGARDLERRADRCACCRATCRSSSTSTRASSPRSSGRRARHRAHAPHVADRRRASRARAHGAPGDRRLALGQRRRRCTRSCCARSSSPTLRSCGRSASQQDQRRHAAALAGQANTGLAGADRQRARSATAGSPTSSSSGLRAAGRRRRDFRRAGARQAGQQGAPAATIANQHRLGVDPHALFDVHVKRIHEYKRQLLNVLHWWPLPRILKGRARPTATGCRAVAIFAGKAALGYRMAKLIIKLINDVAAVINNDPRVGDKLKVVFVPNYNVSLAEVIIPAATSRSRSPPRAPRRRAPAT
jgi:starch phosphorylase